MAKRTRRRTRSKRKKQRGGNADAEPEPEVDDQAPEASSDAEVGSLLGGRRRRRRKGKKGKKSRRTRKKRSTRKKGKKRGLNAYFKLMLNAKKKGLSSFKYKGKTYKGKKHHRLGMIYKKA
jgi:hypothetical protein